MRITKRRNRGKIAGGVNRAGRVCLCFFAAVFLLTALGLTSCAAGEEVPAAAVLSRMLARERDCPAGTVYLSTAEEGSAGELSEGLCAALYGDGTVPAEWAAVEDFAVFLTARDHPAEFAVFRAASRDGAEEIAELCVRRLTALRRYRRGSEYESYTEGAQVVILGRYVVMAVSADAEGAVEEAREELRGAR